MTSGSNLKTRGPVYYARLKVPVELQQLMGTSELIRSLRTKDRRTANLRKLSVLSEWHQKFEDLRRRRDMTEADFANATWQQYVSELRHDDLARADKETAKDIRQYHLKALRDHLGRGETVLVHWAADSFIDQHQLIVEKGSAQYRELCFRLMRAQIEVLLRSGERDLGNYAGVPADPIVTRPAATAEVAKPGERLMDLFNRYEKENPRRVKEAALMQARRDIGTFIELVGEDFPVTRLDKKAAREWKALLMEYPVKAAETGIFKRMGIKTIVAANSVAKNPKPVISPKTVNRYIAAFSSFCNWLVAHDYLAANPFLDMYLSVDKTKTKTKTNVRPFTDEERKVLFASPLFHGCKSDMK